jgi:hypothetical protein
MIRHDSTCYFSIDVLPPVKNIASYQSLISIETNFCGVKRYGKPEQRDSWHLQRSYSDRDLRKGVLFDIQRNHRGRERGGYIQGTGKG